MKTNKTEKLYLIHKSRNNSHVMFLSAQIHSPFLRTHRTLEGNYYAEFRLTSSCISTFKLN